MAIGTNRGGAGSGAGTVRIRRARVADVETLVEHRRGMFEAIGRYAPADLEAHDRVYRRWIRRRLRSGDAVGFVAVRGRRPFGSGVLWLRENQPRPGSDHLVVPYIMSMFVDPALRRSGVGARIARELLRWASRRGYPRVILHASPFGRSVYARLGFERSWEMRSGGPSIPGPEPGAPLDEPSGPRRPGVRRGTRVARGNPDSR